MHRESSAFITTTIAIRAAASDAGVTERASTKTPLPKK
jgi:hypothetical protein